MKRYAKTKLIAFIITSFSLADAVAQEAVKDTIRGEATIIGPTIPVKTVVDAGGKLTIRSLTDVVFKGDFEVKMGGELAVERLVGLPVFFDYDPSGNRIRRRTTVVIAK